MWLIVPVCLFRWPTYLGLITGCQTTTMSSSTSWRESGLVDRETRWRQRSFTALPESEGRQKIRLRNLWSLVQHPTGLVDTVLVKIEKFDSILRKGVRWCLCQTKLHWFFFAELGFWFSWSLLSTWLRPISLSTLSTWPASCVTSGPPWSRPERSTDSFVKPSSESSKQQPSNLYPVCSHLVKTPFSQPAGLEDKGSKFFQKVLLTLM